MSDIAANLAAVRARMASACARAGRDPASARLVAVTKTVGPEEVRRLYDLGVRDFGENRVADGAAQIDALGKPDANWHLIGHLQRNKAGEALAGGFGSIHSVESERLVDVLERECEKRDREIDILIEVNVSGEASKYGVEPDGLPGLIATALPKKRLRIRGLMTMAPLTDDPEAARPVFRGLRELRDNMRRHFSIQLPELSMGMTGDFETAIEEGATMVRIGTALFA